MLTVPQRYGRTDERRDGRTTYDSNTALALRASHGNNNSSNNNNTSRQQAKSPTTIPGIARVTSI